MTEGSWPGKKCDIILTLLDYSTLFPQSRTFCHSLLTSTLLRSVSLQCRLILSGRNLVRVRIVVAAIFDFMTVEDWGEKKQKPSGFPRGTPRQNVYACASLSISGLFFSHTFQSKSPARSQLHSVCSLWFSCSDLFCFMLLVFLTILQLLKLPLWITRHRSQKQLLDQIQKR